MLNRKPVSDTQIAFQDYVESSAELEVGGHVEINNGGPWSVKRYQVLSKSLSDCGVKHDFVAEAV